MSTIANNKIDLLVSFDTTGSMYPVLAQVRREVEQFVKTMFIEFSDLRLGIIAHGDYCDKDNPYTIRVMDFTRDEEKLCKFVRETEKTFGGDADECYELVLNTAHKCLEWRDDADKVMIMIGDASPHGIYYRDNKDGLDWEKEAGILASYGIKVFSVHALAKYRSSSRAFYKRVAEKTLGVYLTLDMFNEIVDLIKATVYQQGGEEKLNEFISIIRDDGKMTHSMENNFKRLRGEEVEEDYRDYFSNPSRGRVSSRKSRSSSKTKTSAADDTVTIKEMGKLVPVIPGRFQIMTVDKNCDIKGFVESNGIEFKKGRGFYELSKAETVQQYKEVIMQDRETGEMFNGSQVREELGLQPQSEKGGVKERLHKDATKKFRVFVQSTSVNRKLIAGTTFLYEISDIEDVGTVIEDVRPVEKAETKVEAPVVEEKAETKVEEAPVVEEAKPAKKTTRKTTKKATKEKVETTTKEEVKPVKAKKTTKKSVDKLASIKKDIDAIDKQLIKLNDALGRYKTSNNKKNTVYLNNNIKKLSELADRLHEKLEV